MRCIPAHPALHDSTAAGSTILRPGRHARQRPGRRHRLEPREHLTKPGARRWVVRPALGNEGPQLGRPARGQPLTCTLRVGDCAGCSRSELQQAACGTCERARLTTTCEQCDVWLSYVARPVQGGKVRRQLDVVYGCGAWLAAHGHHCVHGRRWWSSPGTVVSTKRSQGVL